MTAHRPITLGERDHFRFWQLVIVSPDEADNLCWEWRGKHSKGRAMFSIGRQWHYAARIAWVIVNGPLKPGEKVLHTCDNPGCPRPSHLFTGTQADNVADMIRKGRKRTRSLPGESNPRAKLTADDVRIIRRTCEEEPRSQSRLARHYGVSPHTIWAIVHYKSWKEIT